MVVAQNAAFAEQQKDQPPPPANGYAAGPNGYQVDDSKQGGFAGADAKKRRGVCVPPGLLFRAPLTDPFQRAAPPGRCHSCNRAETPEWRRGPDGARTLCNACGLRRFFPVCAVASRLTKAQTTPSSLEKWAATKQPSEALICVPRDPGRQQCSATFAPHSIENWHATISYVQNTTPDRKRVRHISNQPDLFRRLSPCRHVKTRRPFQLSLST